MYKIYIQKCIFPVLKTFNLHLDAIWTNAEEGFSTIIKYFSFVSRRSVMEIATFRLHTASLHQAIRSTGCAWTYKARCCAVIGWFSTAVIGAFWSSLFLCPVVPSADRCRTVLLLLCVLIVGVSWCWCVLQRRRSGYGRDLRRCRTHQQHRTLPALEWGKVYWSRPTLVQTQGQRGNSHKTSP